MQKLTSSFSINTSTLSSLPSRITSFPTLSSAMASFESNNQEASSSIVEPDQNVLQKHAAFFDRNQDGVVYPWETFRGFRAIGCGVFLSAAFSIFINLTLSQKTSPGKCPSLLLPIEVRNIQRAKHGSDTGVYDSQGRFVALKFEEIFRKHARSHPDALTSHELDAMLKANRVPKDYSGWVGAYAEWKLLYYLCKDKNGLLHKETVRAVYDGTLFHQMEKDHSSRNTL